MNREDIIKLADKQGLVDSFDLEGDSVGELMLCTLVRDCVAAEREVCEKVCIEQADDWRAQLDRNYVDACSDCAAAIRARSNT